MFFDYSNPLDCYLVDERKDRSLIVIIKSYNTDIDKQYKLKQSQCVHKGSPDIEKDIVKTLVM